jgi:ribosomal protein S27AE
MPHAIDAQRCSTCLVEKPLDQFHRNAARRLGRETRCKLCACRRVREHRAAHVEEYRERGRLADKTPKRRAYWKERLARRDPRLARAREAVKYALRIGRLERSPCEACGASEVDAHHDDYSKPLDVRWLCRLCHSAHHKREADLAREARQAAARGVSELDLGIVANRWGA